MNVKSEYYWLDPNKVIVFFNVEGIERIDSRKSRFNRKEAKAIISIIKIMLKHKVNPREIVVLSPFNAQSKMIMEGLRNEGIYDVNVKTVHRYVGGERDIVIFSITGTSRSSLDFIDERLTNVFVTRAKKKLIVVGSSDAIMYNQMLRKLYHYIEKLEREGYGLIVNGSPGEIRTPVRRSRASHPWPLDDRAPGFGCGRGGI